MGSALGVAPARALLASLAALSLGCAPGELESVALIGTVYDAPPEVVFADPLGPDVHRLGGARVRVYDLDNELPGAPLEALYLGGTTAGTVSGEFQLTGAGLTPGRRVAVVADGDNNAPTVFIGQVPESSPDFPFFAFFEGAIFSEPYGVLAERVIGLIDDDTGAVPNRDTPGNGALMYGQILSAPDVLGESEPLAGYQVDIDSFVGSTPVSLGGAAYLTEDLAVDEALGETSGAGVFYRPGLPEGVLELRVSTPGGEALPPVRILSIEDGFAWLAGFYVPGG